LPVSLPPSLLLLVSCIETCLPSDLLPCLHAWAWPHEFSARLCLGVSFFLSLCCAFPLSQPLFSFVFLLCRLSLLEQNEYGQVRDDM